MLIYRRENAAYSSADFVLRGLDSVKEYTITDADTNESVTITGSELMTDGITITIPQKRTAKLYYIRAV